MPSLQPFLFLLVSPDGEWEGARLRRWSVHVQEFLEVGSCFRQSVDFKACIPERRGPGTLGAQSTWEGEVGCSAQGPAPGGDQPPKLVGADS